MLLEIYQETIIHISCLTSIFKRAILKIAKNARPVPSNRNTAGFYILPAKLWMQTK